MNTDYLYQSLIVSVYISGDEVLTRNHRVITAFDLPPVTFTKTPLVTMRKTAWKKALREMEWFMSGASRCPDELLDWWDGQLSEDQCYYDGYSTQLRRSPSSLKCDLTFDQVEYVLNGLRNNPASRRLIMTTWNPFDMAYITRMNKNEQTPTCCIPGFAKVICESRGIVDFDQIDIGDRIWDGNKYVLITNKFHRGKKEVFRYSTRAGDLCCTKDHKVATEQGMIDKIMNCKRIRLSKGGEFERDSINWNLVKNGLILCDGTSHRKKGQATKYYLHIGANDHDYFDTPLKDMVKHYPSKYDNTVYSVVYDFGELPKTYEREIPSDVFLLSRSEICDFMLGVFSANGSVSKTNGNICITQTSCKLAKQIQFLLNYLGIRSSLRMTKGRTTKFRNGTYDTRDRYDLVVLKKDNLVFRDNIGFIQKYKMDRICVDEAKVERNNVLIENTESIGIVDVYDITVDSDEHLFWCDGFLVSNCHGSFVQFFVRNQTLHMKHYQRSADMLLGLPHNFIQYWSLLLYFAHHAELNVGSLIYLIGDAHLYCDPSHDDVVHRIRHMQLDPTKEPSFKLRYCPKATKDAVPEYRASDFRMEGEVPEPVIKGRPIRF